MFNSKNPKDVHHYVRLAAKRWAKMHGAHGETGGWVYDSTGKPICQGFSEYAYQRRVRIAEAILDGTFTITQDNARAWFLKALPPKPTTPEAPMSNRLTDTELLHTHPHIWKYDVLQVWKDGKGPWVDFSSLKSDFEAKQAVALVKVQAWEGKPAIFRIVNMLKTIQRFPYPTKPCGNCGWIMGAVSTDPNILSKTIECSNCEEKVTVDCRVPSDSDAHVRDADCTVDHVTHACTVCGVEHGDHCPVCLQRAFHLPSCSRIDRQIAKPTAPAVDPWSLITRLADLLEEAHSLDLAADHGGDDPIDCSYCDLLAEARDAVAAAKKGR